MASLSAHLREPDHHGRLPFHPECPLCRERLSGVLAADAVVSPRAQALVAAGALALASGTPTTALAAGPDREQEGAAGPLVAPADPNVSPDFDPGGGSADLPFDAGPAPQPQSSPDDDAVPVEQEAATDGDGVVADPGDGSGTTGVAPQPPPPPQSPAPLPTPTPGPAISEPPPGAPGSAAPVGTPAPPATEPASPTGAGERQVRRESRQRTPAATSAAPSAVAVDAPSTVSYVTTTVQATPSLPASSPSPVSRHGRASRGDLVHVVQPGESLWSIARDLVGKDASVATIAREVNRLWELNSARIGTGEPDLLMAGTRLALR